METAFGLYVPENGTIPCTREMVPVSVLQPFPPDFSNLNPTRTFFMFNELRSRPCQRALLG